jgi:hypothetical protein
MAFLDNSGDIILDAVLTDAGRRRLARGDGSFRIAKYSFGDDEINYGSYIATHESGSAYYDLEILQTPVLEAFTNNISSMKSKLITLTNNNLLYLPVIELNDSVSGFKTAAAASIASGTHAVLVDQDTVNEFGKSTSTNTRKLTNFVDGLNGPTTDTDNQKFRLDQGLDTTEISAVFNLDAELTENQYIIELDNRFATVCDIKGNVINPSFIDDDNVASYYVSTNDFVTNLQTNTNTQTTDSVIAGPRGTKLEFSVLSSVSLRTSTFLFNQLGTADGAFQYIDTTIRVQGATTGYRIDVPVRFIKKT